MSALATIRPNDWDLPLFLHVLGAMTLVGALVLSATSLAAAVRGGSLETLRVGYRALAWGVFPAFIVMRVGAEWIASKEDLADDPPSWVDTGYFLSDAGFVVLIVTMGIAGFGLRRARQAESTAAGSGLIRAAAVLGTLLIVAYVVAIWVMTTKPT